MSNVDLDCRPRTKTIRPRRRRKSRGNAGTVESVESQQQASHTFHEPLEISPKAGEIPTFPRLQRQSPTHEHKKAFGRRSAPPSWSPAPPPRWSPITPPLTSSLSQVSCTIQLLSFGTGVINIVTAVNTA